MNAYTIAAVPPVLFLIAACHDPALFLWFLAVAAFVAIAALAIAGHHFRTERDEARETAARLDRQLDAERDVRRRTEAAFAQFQQAVAAGTIRRGSNVIPIQRRGDEWPSWLENALDEQAETWPTDGGAS